MTLKTRITENIAKDKETIANTISSVKIRMDDYQKESKSDWKSLTTKFKVDMDRVKKSLKKLVNLDVKKA